LCMLVHWQGSRLPAQRGGNCCWAACGRQKATCTPLGRGRLPKRRTCLRSPRYAPLQQPPNPTLKAEMLQPPYTCLAFLCATSASLPLSATTTSMVVAQVFGERRPLWKRAMCCQGLHRPYPVLWLTSSSLHWERTGCLDHLASSVLLCTALHPNLLRRVRPSILPVQLVSERFEWFLRFLYYQALHLACARCCSVSLCLFSCFSTISVPPTVLIDIYPYSI
jgi:hypothetical protein